MGDSMEKIIIKKDLFCLPWTQTILGTHYRGKPNFMALAWLTRVNNQPAMIGISVNNNHASNEAIRENGEFSVNVPSADMVEIADYTGLVSGKSVDKSGLFEVFYGDLTAAPMIERCPVTMECKLAHTVELPTNTFVIGEIINLYSEESYLTEGMPDAKKTNSFILTKSDNHYRVLGESVGKAWSAGKVLKNRIEKGECR